MKEAAIIIVFVLVLLAVATWCPICLWHLVSGHRERAICLKSWKDKA